MRVYEILSDTSAFQRLRFKSGSTYPPVKYVNNCHRSPVSSATPLGPSQGVSHKGCLQEGKQNTILNTFDSLEVMLIWNAGIRQCRLRSHEQAAFPSVFSLTLVLLSLLLGKSVLVTNSYVDLKFIKA